jgi:hypothetical protein
MCHLAMLEGTGDGDGTTWLEPVTGEEYQVASKHWQPGGTGPSGHRLSSPVILLVCLRPWTGGPTRS